MADSGKRNDASCSILCMLNL